MKIKDEAYAAANAHRWRRFAMFDGWFAGMLAILAVGNAYCTVYCIATDRAFSSYAINLLWALIFPPWALHQFRQREKSLRRARAYERGEWPEGIDEDD